MKSFISIFALAVLSTACGKQVITNRLPTPGNCLTDCKTGTGTHPTPAPVAPLVLTVSGDEPSPPPSSYTVNASFRVPGATPAGWQALGQNNQPVVIKTVTTSLTLSGQCVPVDVKTVVSGSAPASHAGTFYLATDGSKFKVCLDNGDVLVTFEDIPGTTDFNDYQIRIHGNKPLRYEWQNEQLFVCID